MKFYNLLFFSFFLLSVQFSFGQTKQGHIPLGGSVSGGFIIEEVRSFFHLNAAIESGYFLTDHFMVTGFVNGGLSRQTGGSSNIDGKNLMFGLGARYYWRDSQLQPFVGLELQHGIQHAVVHNDVIIIEVIQHSFVTDIKGGFSYFVNENMAFELFIPIRINPYMIFKVLNPTPSSRVNFNRLHTAGIGTSFRVFL